MKTLDQIRAIKKQFGAEYGPALTAVGNHLSYGIGKDAATGEFTIKAYLTNDTLKSALPDTYQDVKVEVEIIGEIVAF